jgi:hypothetical protein
VAGEITVVGFGGQQNRVHPALGHPLSQTVHASTVFLRSEVDQALYRHGFLLALKR